MMTATDPHRLDKPLVARSFARAAMGYDHFAGLQRQVADTLLARLSHHTHVDTMLDLGCGTGYCSQGLARRFPDATLLSLDIAESMLLQARVKGTNPTGHYICADAEALPLASASQSLVVSSLTIQWCQNLGALFAELYRIARPGARLLLSTFGPATLQELRAAWAEVDGMVHVNRFPAPQVLTQALSDAGFSAVKVESEHLLRHYSSLAALTSELKGVGAHNVNQGQPRGLMGRQRLAGLNAAFEAGRVAGRGIPVTWEVLYLDIDLGRDKS